MNSTDLVHYRLYNQLVFGGNPKDYCKMDYQPLRKEFMIPGGPTLATY